MGRGRRRLSGAGDRDRGPRRSQVGDAFCVALEGGRLRSHGLWIAIESKQKRRDIFLFLFT